MAIVPWKDSLDTLVR